VLPEMILIDGPVVSWDPVEVKISNLIKGLVTLLISWSRDGGGEYKPLGY